MKKQLLLLTACLFFFHHLLIAQSDDNPLKIIAQETDTLDINTDCIAILPQYWDHASVQSDVSNSFVLRQFPDPGTNYEVGDHVITLHAQDDKGNTATHDIKIHVKSPHYPFIQWLHHEILYFDEEGKITLPDFVSHLDLEVDDICDDNPTIVQTPAPGVLDDHNAVKEVTIEVTNKHGNASSRTFKVSYLDSIPPTVVVPEKPHKLYIDPYRCETEIPDFSKIFEVSDNHSGWNLTYHTPGVGAFIYHTGIIDVRMVVADWSGNSTEVVFPVEIVDTIGPRIIPMEMQTLYLNESKNIVVPDYRDKIDYYVSCDWEPVITQSPEAGSTISPEDASFITVTITDEHGNAPSYDIPIRIYDTISEWSISGPAGHLIYANEDCIAPLEDLLPIITVSDYAPITLSQSPAAGTMLEEDTPVTIIAEDINGIRDSLEISVMVLDTIPPQFEVVPDINTVYVNEECAFILPDYTPEVFASDNCGIEAEITQTPAAGTELGIGEHMITFTAQDKNFNYNTYQAYVSVEDNTPPQFIEKMTTQVILTDGFFEKTPLLDYMEQVKIQDNCDPDPIISQSPEPGTLIGGLFNQIKITAIDRYGNQSIHKFKVHVIKDWSELADVDLEKDFEIDEDDTLANDAHPNPFSEEIRLEAESNDLDEISIIDLAGNTVHMSNGSVLEINTEDLKAGIYILQTRDKAGNIFHKKMIKRE